jgi:hypothetical protein
MRSRLLAVQGPLQFIAGFLAMEWYQKVRGESENSKSTLLLYDFLTAENVEADLYQVINRIAGIRAWHAVIFISGKDMRAMVQGRYSDSMQRLRNLIGENDFDEIFLARDFCGYGSPLIVNTYRNAKRIIYGDSLGVVGNEAALGGVDWNSPLRWLISLGKQRIRDRLFGGPDRIKFDAAVLTLPIVCSTGYLDEIPLMVPHRDLLVDTIRAVYGRLGELQEYCTSLIGRCGAQENPLLFLLSNLSGSGLTTREGEVSLYAEIINSVAPPGSAILLKGHPRDSAQTLAAVVDRLHPNYKVIIIDDPGLARVPIELWVGLIERTMIVPIFSTSAINLRYIFGKTVQLPLNEDRIRRHFFKSKIRYMILGTQLISRSIENLATWDGRSALFESTL